MVLTQNSELRTRNSPFVDLNDPGRLGAIYGARKETLGAKKAGRITFGGAARGQRQNATMDALLEGKPLAQAVHEFGPEAVTKGIVGAALRAGQEAAREHVAAQPTSEPKLLPFPRTDSGESGS